MHHLSTTLSAAIARRHGTVTRRELIDDGLSTETIRRLVTARVLRRQHNGVYRLTTHPDRFEARCAAACLAAPDVVVTGTAAGHLWEFRHVGRPTTPILLAPHERSNLAGAVLIRRTNVLDPTDVVSRDDGIRLASPPRAWFDCAVDVDDDTFEAITEWVLDHHASYATLRSMIRRLDAPGRPGLARAKRVLGSRPAWQKPADSRLELRVLNALQHAGLGTIVRQHRVEVGDGVVVHLDGALPDMRWGVEIDHVTWHGGRLDAQADKRRDRQLRSIGWQIERVTDRELADDFDRTIDSLVQLATRRRRDLAA